MKNKLFLILMFPIAIVLFMLSKHEHSNDISNMPFSLVPKYTKFTKPAQKNYISYPLLEKDYHNLIDIDFKFETLPYICKNQHPFLLILVHSAPDNFKHRKAIRDTWGNASQNTKLVFLLGSVDKTSEKNRTMEKISQEIETFQDLVIGSFIDAYKNLTYKHVMGLKYAVYHCKEAPYVLKTDDDVFVNIPDFLTYIMSNVSPFGAEKLLMCNVWKDANVARSFKSRYRFSVEEYPYKTFPTYCSGWFILYSPDVVFDLYSLAQKSDYFWVDDVFITGILAAKTKISHFNIKNIVISKRRMKDISHGVCDGAGEKFLLGRPNIDSNLVRKLWACSVSNTANVNL